MSYIHNEEADFAASELARMFLAEGDLCFAGVDEADRPNFNAFASKEPSNTRWPIADGVISLINTNDRDDVAMEYKRVTEGVHGLLTAVGQTLAYVDKGYKAAVMVIPREYTSHDRPADHVLSILEKNSIDQRVGVFDYSPPDKSSARPFDGRIRCIRPVNITATGAVAIEPISGRASTQWAHIREGSTTRDAMFCYLKSAIRLSCGGDDIANFDIPDELIAAINRLDPEADAAQYLSYTSDDTFGSRVWRDFWFTYIATREVLTPFVSENGAYRTPNTFTRILKDDDSGHSQIFEGRANGLKEFLVEKLNSGEISEDEAWEATAAGFSVPEQQNKQGVRARAHSYREDVDSSVAQMSWIDNAGHPTDEGYRFVSICERFGGANSQAAKDYFGATLIQTGHFGTFLHYIHRLSEEVFSANPLEFTEEVDDRAVFTENSYWNYLEFIENHLVNDLRVMHKAPGRRRARVRTTFQAELTFLRKYGFIPAARNQRYRLGVGLPINWVKVHEAMQAVL